VLPVVEPSAFHLAFIQRKTQWLNEVQRRACSEAGATGVPGVPVNFWMNEDDVDSHPFYLTIAGPLSPTVDDRKNSSTRRSR
jgi:hypothetical protein